MNKFRFSQKFGSQFELTRGGDEKLDSDALKVEFQKCDTNKLWTTDISGKLAKQVKLSKSSDEEMKKVVQSLVSFSSKCSRFAEYSPLSMMLTKMSDMLVDQSNNHFQLNKRLSEQAVIPLQNFVAEDIKNAKAARKKYEKVRSSYAGVVASNAADSSMEDARKEFETASAEVLSDLTDCNATLQIYMLKSLLCVYEANVEYFRSGLEWLESNKPIFDEMKKKLMEETRKVAQNRSRPREKVVDPRVFGVPLEQLLAKEEGDGFIPRFVSHAMDYVEANCIELVGVFRISAAKQLVMDVKAEIDSGMVFPNFSEYKDAHVAPALLKEYLRDMPEPLMTFEQYPKLIEANRVTDPKERIEALRACVWALPKMNRMFLRRLLGLLKKVSEHQGKNKMGATNLATVVGPNILYAKESNPATIVEDMQTANEIVTSLITEYAVVFENRTIVEAIMNENIPDMEKLVAAGQKYDDHYAGGQTPLHCACEEANMEVVKFLLDKNVPVNPLDEQGRTPAIIACRGTHMHQGVLLLLARKGADLSAKDINGNDILTMAKNIAPDGKLVKAIQDANAQYLEWKQEHDRVSETQEAEDAAKAEALRKEEEAAEKIRAEEEEAERLRTEEVVLDDIHSLQSLVKEDVALHSMYKLLNIQDVIDAAMNIVEGCANGYDDAKLTVGLKGCVAAVKQLFSAVPQFVKLFSEKPKQLIVQNTSLLQDSVRGLISTIQKVMKEKENAEAQEELMNALRILIDTIYKLFRACEVAAFDYTKQVMQDTVQSIAQLIGAASSVEKEEALEDNLKQVATTAQKLFQLVEARQLKHPVQSVRDDLSAQLLVVDALLLEVINTARLVAAKHVRKQEIEAEAEELKNAAKNAVSEIQQMAEMLGEEPVEEALDAQAFAMMLADARKGLYEVAVPLQKVGLTKLDQAIVIQLQTLVNTLGTLAQDSTTMSQADTVVHMKKVIDAFNKIRIGLNQMAPEQRDIMFRRKLRIFVEVLTYGVLALKVGTMAQVTDSSIKSDIQPPITIRDASQCCREFFEDLHNMRKV